MHAVVAQQCMLELVPIQPHCKVLQVHQASLCSAGLSPLLSQMTRTSKIDRSVIQNQTWRGRG